MRIATGLLVLVLFAAPATAGIVINTGPGAGTEGIDTSIWVAQTFTAPALGLLGFGFELEDTGADDLFVQGLLYATSSGLPTGSALFSSTPIAIGTQGVYTFNTSVSLTAGSVYAIVPGVTAGAGVIYGTGADVYAGGTAINSANAGTDWFLIPTADASIVILATPEPATVLLLGLGLIALAGTARRRRRA